MPVKERPAIFRALGRQDPPPDILCNAKTYSLLEVYKHDSWAATAAYGAEDGSRIVCKFNRASPVLILPMGWLGRILARRENWFYRKLADVEGVPEIAEVRGAAGELLPNVSAHVFVEGKPFQHPGEADDQFFDRLTTLVAALHQRDIAYVDLHKKENVIVDLQGRPHLVDFQVSFSLGRRWPANGAIARYLLDALTSIDRYNLNKHIIRGEHGNVSPEELARLLPPPRILRWHRQIAVPLRTLRRAFLVKIGIRSGKGMATSELNPEIAFRTDKPETD
ncbi:hypothetical protein IMCC20628_02108 [Hoeflea sp. IMCC20628]|uniref:hypothetical protein n=1 Tax=Hoeflea sp. IMCC20628 TaxID=1620421 RepID=UPI00063BDEB7|nr:hypothetical protein [Hoeflea sp. IMCC20628]AKI00812.1 hypothetical protein IMCC20628_02108 [Hoeflea sp. IMCC20628]